MYLITNNIQSKSSYFNAMNFHPNFKIHNLRKIKWNESFFFILGKRVSDFRISMKILSK